jgi:hypothetical protein
MTRRIKSSTDVENTKWENFVWNSQGPSRLRRENINININIYPGEIRVTGY